jgi:hypothetical protein
MCNIRVARILILSWMLVCGTMKEVNSGPVKYSCILLHTHQK